MVQIDLGKTRELARVASEVAYYFHCMSESDLLMLKDMMGDLPPIEDLDRALDPFLELVDGTDRDV